LHVVLPAGWQSTCRLTPAAPPPIATQVTREYAVRYRPGVRLDLYLPVGTDRPRPAVVAVHGGGWRVGSRTGMSWTATRLARAGFVVAAPDYALSSPSRPSYRAALGDIDAAVRYLRHNATRLGVDPGRIGAVGSSAGGHLAMLAADRATGPCTTGDRVAAVATWSSPLALPALAAADASSLLAGMATDLLGCSYDECPARWRRASPTSWATRDDPPALIYTSTEEFMPAAQASAMAAALRHARVPEWTVRLPGHRHASDYRADAIDNTITFLRTVLAGG
jgi:acetyl esterase/lipase